MIQWDFTYLTNLSSRGRKVWTKCSNLDYLNLDSVIYGQIVTIITEIITDEKNQL